MAWLASTVLVAGMYLGYRALAGNNANYVTIGSIDVTPVNLGEIGMACTLGSVAYFIRKRIAIGAFGDLETWLWAHICLSTLGVMFVWFHSRQRFSSDEWLANLAMLVLLGTAVTGVVFRCLYLLVPRLLSRLPDYDPMDVLISRIGQLANEADALTGLKSRAFFALGEHVRARPLDYVPGGRGQANLRMWRTSLPLAEQADFDRLTMVLVQHAQLSATLERRQGYRRLLDGWWLVHVWLTEAGIVLALIHAFNSLVLMGRWS